MKILNIFFLKTQFIFVKTVSKKSFQNGMAIVFPYSILSPDAIAERENFCLLVKPRFNVICFLT